MRTKKNILIFVDWFYPGFLAGGPIQSILSLVNYLNHDFNFKIITTNRDLNMQEPYPNIIANKWIKSELNCEVYYAESTTLNYKTIRDLMRTIDFDLVYINSFFSVNFSILPLRILNKYYQDVPVVFAPRGMLGEGALAIKSFKKRIFIFFTKITGLHKRVIWHATSKQEEQEIRKTIDVNATIHCLSNLPKKFETSAIRQKMVKQLNMCFISRISYKKNLLFALQILQKIKGLEISFDIYGPIEDQNYWSQCEEAMKRLPAQIKVNYCGIIQPSHLEKVYSYEHVMFLPTLNENFGHSIVESLMCGCPVIISDQTPWNDLETFEAGFAIELTNTQKFVDAIVHYANLNQTQFNAVSVKANNYISDKIDINGIVNQYITLFNDSIKN